MSKRLHSYISICLIFLFSFLLAESGLHALIHADHHVHPHEASFDEIHEHKPDGGHSNADLKLEPADEVCNLCSEFTQNVAYEIISIAVSTFVCTGPNRTTISLSLSGNTETTLNPTRGPPMA